MFSYRIFAGSDGSAIQPDVFLILTYYVPELVPSIMILISVNTSLFESSEAELIDQTFGISYVDPLLKEQADCDEALNEVL